MKIRTAIVILAVLAGFGLTACKNLWKEEEGKTYTIRYYDEESGKQKSVKVKPMELYTLTVPKKDGYVFIGYAEDSEGSYFMTDERGKLKSSLYKDIILYQIFIKINYITVKFEGDNTGAYEDIIVGFYIRNGGIIYYPNRSLNISAPIKEGHDFVGWYSSEEEDAVMCIDHSGLFFNRIGEEGKNGAEEITVYPRWGKSYISITLDPGYGGTPRTSIVLYDEQVDHSASAKLFGEREDEEAYYEVSYFSAEPGSTEEFEGTITSPVTLYAVWKPIGYFVTLDPGDGSPVIKLKCPLGSKLNTDDGMLLPPKKENGLYYGVSFLTKTPGSSIEYDEEIMSPVTLYPVYGDPIPQSSWGNKTANRTVLSDEDMLIFSDVITESNAALVISERTKALVIILDNCTIEGGISSASGKITICFMGTNIIKNGISGNGSLTIYASGILAVTGTAGTAGASETYQRNGKTGISSGSLTFLNWGGEPLYSVRIIGGDGGKGRKGQNGKNGSIYDKLGGDVGDIGDRGGNGGAGINSPIIKIDLKITVGFTVIGGKGGDGGDGGNGGNGISGGNGGSGGYGGDGGNGISTRANSYTLNIDCQEKEIRGGQGGSGGQGGQGGSGTPYGSSGRTGNSGKSGTSIQAL